MKAQFDIVVIGGGHAGCEAALAASKMGHTCALVTLAADRIAAMSCNPCIGGIGKGQLVKEIDALGGEMGKNADATGIQFRRLNTRKGSAVQSTRCQSDKNLYAKRMGAQIRSAPSIIVLEAEVKSLKTEDKSIVGADLRYADGRLEAVEAKAVILTAGTFMRGLMHFGENQEKGGRVGEKSSVGLSDQLRELGFRVLRLKTGTPPRLLKGSLDYERLQIQLGDSPPPRFSFSDTENTLPQVACHLTFTNESVHRLIADNMHRSPLYSGQIQGIGPRYCPSIEDKVVKFPDKPRHQVFLEPESLDSDWIYPNGVSTSLPSDVQERFIRAIPGCEEAKFARFGYAVEYDCIDPTELNHSLGSKRISGLFLAGQVNGTSGYEEAASQGLIAGINAALFIQRRPSFHISRTESYIGVMIDDLVTRGVTEPYRMFTSRAEFRLSLREDNADIRLRPYGIRFGLVGKSDQLQFEERKAAIERTRVYLRKFHVKQSAERSKSLSEWGTQPIRDSESLSQLLKRPQLTLNQVLSLVEPQERMQIAENISETLEIDVKYEGYIDIQRQEIERLKRLEKKTLPHDLKYAQIDGLSYEVRERLTELRPSTLAEASKISGVTPAALTAILAFLKKRGRNTAFPSQTN